MWLLLAAGVALLKLPLSTVAALWAELRIVVHVSEAQDGVTIAKELTERDVHGALSVVAESAAPDAGGPFGLPVLERLTELIGVDHALAYIEYDLHTHAWGPGSVEYPVVEYPWFETPCCAASTRCAKSPSAIQRHRSPSATSSRRGRASETLTSRR